MLLPLLLAGCVTLFPDSRTYTPFVVRVDNPALYALDLVECHEAADNYSPGFNTGTVAQATIQGATSNSAYAVINPLVPAAGAASGAATATMEGVGITSHNSIVILSKCITELTRRDHSAVVADPNS